MGVAVVSFVFVFVFVLRLANIYAKVTDIVETSERKRYMAVHILLAYVAYISVVRPNNRAHTHVVI